MILKGYAGITASANEFSVSADRVERDLHRFPLAEGPECPTLLAFEFNDWLRGELSVEFLNGDLKPGSRERL
jgi:hypothetical protein